MMMILAPELPVAVIGAGPVGLAAAAHLVERGIRPRHLRTRRERRRIACSNGRMCGSSRPGATTSTRPRARLLERVGMARARRRRAADRRRDRPRNISRRSPRCPQIAANLKLGATVTGDHPRRARQGLVARPRQGALRHPLHRWRRRRAPAARPRGHRCLRHLDAAEPDGRRRPRRARRARGCGTASPTAFRTSSARARSDYAGKRVLVVGGGHSAINVALALMELQDEAPQTEIFWALRRNGIDRLLGGGLNDQLPERGALGLAAKQAMDDGRLKMLAPFAAERVAARRRWRRGRRRSLGGKPFDARRRPDHRRDRLPARSLLPARTAGRARSRGRGAARARAADRSEPPFLRHRAAARHRRAGASRARLLHRRLEVLRPRADLPDGDRLRAGALGRRRARRRPRGRARGAAGAAGDRRLQRRPHRRASRRVRGCCGGPAPPKSMPAASPMPRRRRRQGGLRLRRAPAPRRAQRTGSRPNE